MPGTVVVGTQWGDEGKGKVVDVLAPVADLVVRYQGGNNAGHTLVVGGRKTVLHLVPSGILHPGTLCVVGNGVVLDPVVFLREFESLAAAGRTLTPEDIVLSSRAQVILPWHRALDRLREQARGGDAIGTTGKGIGPCYEDKAARRGIRVGDFVDPERFRARVEALLPEKNRMITEWFGGEPLSVDGSVGELAPLAARLRPYVTDTVALLHHAVRGGKTLLFEGAQGTFLDIDHGTYPFVTSSNTVAGAACAGSGVGPSALTHVVGIAKAYTTRVGWGPFPTECEDAVGDHLRSVGQEYGSTTGRPRRCGWFDAALLRSSVMLNGLTHIALTKLDVLSGLPTVRICTGYEGHDALPDDLVSAVPVYEDLPGWVEDLSGCRTFEALPATCQAYVERLEELVGVPAGLISIGPDRAHTIVRDPLFGEAP